jgi:hypothetical protein
LGEQSRPWGGGKKDNGTSISCSTYYWSQHHVSAAASLTNFARRSTIIDDIPSTTGKTISAQTALEGCDTEVCTQWQAVID